MMSAIKTLIQAKKSVFQLKKFPRFLKFWRVLLLRNLNLASPSVKQKVRYPRQIHHQWKSKRLKLRSWRSKKRSSNRDQLVWEVPGRSLMCHLLIWIKWLKTLLKWILLLYLLAVKWQHQLLQRSLNQRNSSIRLEPSPSHNCFPRPSCIVDRLRSNRHSNLHQRGMVNHLDSFKVV